MLKFGVKESIILLLTLTLLACPSATEPEAPGAPAVVITGASSGLGRATAVLLAQSGYYVYAGARSERDLKELEAIPNIKAVKLDVTVGAEIADAVKLVRAEGRPLAGLINNAGIAVVGPLIEVAESDVKRQLEVNVLGPYRVTKAFAPLLLEDQGRVINVSSISGLMTGPLYGPYAMSKHALEAYSESLAFELAPLGVKVVTIQPGNYESKIFGKAQAQGWTKDTQFGPEMKRYLQGLSTRPKGPPIEVALAMKKALEESSPGKRHYLTVHSQAEGDIVVGALFHKLAHLNHDQPHSYTREEMIAMLDQALERFPAAQK